VEVLGVSLGPILVRSMGDKVRQLDHPGGARVNKHWDFGLVCKVAPPVADLLELNREALKTGLLHGLVQDHQASLRITLAMEPQQHPVEAVRDLLEGDLYGIMG